MAKHVICGKCPSCHKLTTFEFCGKQPDGAGSTVTLYTCLNCGTTRSKHSIIAATTGQKKAA